MEIINKDEKKFEEELKRNGIPYVINYYNYFNGAGGYRDFWITNIKGEYKMFEIERYEKPINQTFKIYFIANENNEGEFEVEEEHDVIHQYIKHRYKIIYNKDSKKWLIYDIEHYFNEED